MTTTTHNELNQSCADCAADQHCVVSRSECIENGYFIRKPVEKEPAHTSCRGCVEYFPRHDTPKACMNCFETKHQERSNYTPAPAPAPDVVLIGDLLPCPFCGGQAEVGHDDHVKELYCVFCSRCLVRIYHNCESGAVDLWNRRQPAPKVTDAPAPDGFYDAWKDIFNECLDLGMKMPDKLTSKETVIAFIRTLAQRAGEGNQIREQSKKYMELLMAVSYKFPGESRHETALKYIRQAEKPSETVPVTTRADGEKSKE